MKLSPHAFTRFWDVHAWVGVCGGIVLHVMFFAGGFSLFYEELCDWQEPEGSVAPAVAEGGRVAGAGPPARVSALVEKALRAGGTSPGALKAVDLSLPGPHRRFLEVSWNEPGRGPRREVRVEAASGAVAPETSHLGRTLFWLHFLYHPKATWGMYVAGVMGLGLLLAIVTGVLIHLKDLARQLHQFRPERSPRVLWSDLHKVLGVMGLPFQLMYAFTGTLLCFLSVMLALATGPLFGGDAAAARRALWGERAEDAAAAAAGTARGQAPVARAPDLDQLLARARAVAPGFQPSYVHLTAGPGATASIWGERPDRLFGRGDVVLRAGDGALVEDTSAAAPTPAGTLARWVAGLHYVWFGGLGAKVLYALLAAASCFTILTGNWIWLVRRSGQAASRGHRLLARLTIGAGGGVVVAAAAMFWANRLAPPGARMAAESWAFFGTWALVTALFLLRAESRGGWLGLLRVAGAGFALTPLVGVAVSRRLGASGVDAGLMIFGVALLGIAALVRRHGAVTAFGSATRVALAESRAAGRGA